jgi:hypothetical protein
MSTLDEVIDPNPRVLSFEEMYTPEVEFVFHPNGDGTYRLVKDTLVTTDFANPQENLMAFVVTDTDPNLFYELYKKSFIRYQHAESSKIIPLEPEIKVAKPNIQNYLEKLPKIAFIDKVLMMQEKGSYTQGALGKDADLSV